MVGFFIVTIFMTFIQFAIFERRLETMTTVKMTMSIVIMIIIATLIGNYYHENYSLQVAEWLLSFSPYYNK